MNEIKRTKRTELSRAQQRGSHDRETIYKIVDEAMVCQVGFIRNGHPVVLPMAYGRMGNEIFLHGATESPFLKDIISSETVAVSIFLLDGLVFARSAYRHSMNYRSVVIYAKPREVTSGKEKIRGLRALMDRLLKDRWDSVRPPSDSELGHTAVIAISLEESSAKIRTGPPNDGKNDLSLPVWAGVLPLKIQAGIPVREERCFADPEKGLLDYRREDYTD